MMKRAITITILVIDVCMIAVTALRGQTDALIVFSLSLLIAKDNLDKTKGK